MRLDYIKDSVVKFTGIDPSRLDFCDDFHIIVDKNVILLTNWRYDRRIMSLRALAIEDNVLRQNCSYKSTRIAHKNDDMKRTLFAEIDTCQWILGDKITSVYAQMETDKTLSLVMKTERGVLLSIEIALTLSEDTPPVTRHEIVGKEGMICDRSINEQVPFEAVYLFENDKKSPLTYTDMEASFYGLLPDEISLAENIIASIPGYRNNFEKCDEQQIEKVISAVYKSAELGENVKVEDIG